MSQKVLIKTFHILLIFIFSIFKSQVYTLEQLDNITEQYRAKDDIQGAINFNKSALKTYHKVNNTEGIAAAQINIANYLSISNEFKESMKQLEECEKYIKQIKNPEIISKFHACYARNYSLLALYEQSNNKLDEAINFANRIKDKKKKERRLYLEYSWKLINFQRMQLTDSIKKVEKQCLALSPDPILYINITQRFLGGDSRNLDSAEYYLDKASKIVDKFSDYEKGNVFFYYGNLYTEKKEYEKAIENYQKSIQIFEKNKHNENLRESYKFISEVYHKINDKEKEAEYLHKYRKISDILTVHEKKAINISVEKTIQEKEKQQKEEKNKLYAWISAIVLIILCMFFLIYKTYKKKQKLKDQAILEKDLETENLKKQLNISSFDEIMHLAKKGDPFFLARFQELYPDFINTLTSKYPELTANDIRFCAFLKLNLTNKEIMQYEHLSIRTVETKKYRIRKKIGVSSNVDLNKWFMEL